MYLTTFILLLQVPAMVGSIQDLQVMENLEENWKGDAKVNGVFSIHFLIVLL